MSDLLKKIEREAQKLTPRQRIMLADRLMSPFRDDSVLNDVEMEWIEKAENNFSEGQVAHGEGSQASGAFREEGKLFK